MKRLSSPALVILSVACVLVLWTSTRADEEPAVDKSVDVVVINMTAGKDDLHSVWMGLKLAENALDSGRGAVVFMNVKAAVLASKKCPEDLRFGEMPPIRKHIATILEKGGSVITCPGCSKVAGITKEDLLPGVTMATEESLFGRMNPDTVVFSY